MLLVCAAAIGANQQDAPKETAWSQAELERMSAEIEADLERLRGDRFVRPVSVRLASREDLIEYVKLRFEKSESPEKVAADEEVAKLLGVFPAERSLMTSYLDFLSGQVVGFYDPDTDSFSLMDTCPKDLARITMAHELGHALDDQLFSIDGTLASLGADTDRIMAFQAVVEGSGTAVMNQWTLENIKSLSTDALMSSQDLQMQALADAPAWLWRPTFAAYMQGAAFLQHSETWLTAQLGKASAADIRAAFTTPPRSTEQVLHPDKYWLKDKVDEPLALRFEIAELPTGWTLRREDSLGELALAVVTSTADQRGGLSLAEGLGAITKIRFTNEIAKGWGGDRLVLFGAEKARVLHWATRWDTERDAAEFYGAMSLRANELLEAARAVAGADAATCDVALDYGDDAKSVTLTVRAGVKSSEAKRVLRAVKLAR